MIDSVLEDEKKLKKKIVEVEKMLRLRLGEHKGDVNYKKFAEKLDELRRKMEERISDMLVKWIRLTKRSFKIFLTEVTFP